MSLALYPKAKVKSEILYFLINASPPKLLDVATSNFADALVNSKVGFAIVYYRLKSRSGVVLDCIDS